MRIENFLLRLETFSNAIARNKIAEFLCKRENDENSPECGLLEQTGKAVELRKGELREILYGLLDERLKK